MAAISKTYLDKLKAGSPQVGAWFRSADYEVEVGFGASYGSPARPHDGIRVKGKSGGRIAFHAPFNGWAQLASPRQGKVSYTGVDDADKWEEVVDDPTLRGLRHLDGKPFRPGKNGTEGFTLLFTCFPAAYLRLKWLFQSKLGAARLVPHRFAVTVEKRDDFIGSEGIKQLNASLEQQGLYGLAGQALAAGLQALGLDPRLVQPPSVQADWDRGNKVEPSPQYYAPVGTKILTATTMDLVVFDEHGWPLDPVYVWHALAKVVAEDAETLQEGYQKASGSGGNATDPLKDYDLCTKSGTQTKRVTLHTVGMHGEAADPYLRRALKVDSDSGFELDSVTEGQEPPVRRATPKSSTGTPTAQQLKLKLDLPSGCKSEGALGLAPSGSLAEKTLEHTPLDYDFVRLVLMDQTRHVARNRPADVTKTATDAFPSSVTLREHKKETVVTPLLDGLAVWGAIDDLLQKAAACSERRVAWMVPRLDPFLDLKGYRGGAFPLEKQNAAVDEKWGTDYEQKLAALEQHLAVHVVAVTGGADLQLLAIADKTLPAGAYVRAFPLEVGLKPAEPGRGGGAAAFATKNGGCLLPLGKATKNLWLDILVVARGDSGALQARWRAGFQQEGLPLKAEATANFDFGQAYLSYDSSTGKAALTIDPTCSTAWWYVLAINPRTGWLYDSAAKGQKAGGGVGGQPLTLPLCEGEGNQLVPRVAAGDPLLVGIAPATGTVGSSSLQGCVGWHGFAFPPLLQAAGLVPLPASSILKRLVESGKGDGTKQWVMVHRESLLRPVDERLRAQLLDQALETRLGKQFLVSDRVHGMAERRESALYAHGKPASGSSDQESERAVVCSAPVTGLYGDARQREWGDPQAEPGRAKATVGLALQGRASHALYKEISRRARAHGGAEAKSIFPDNDTHAEKAPGEQAVKDSPHRAALLRTLPQNLDGNDAAQAEVLAALADAIRQATTSIYVESPFFDLNLDRARRGDKGKLDYTEGRLNLLQLLHDQLRKQPGLRVIVCTPRDIRHPWGAAVEAGWYEARKEAVLTLRYDGAEKGLVEGHQVKPTAGGVPQLYTAATLIHDRAVVFHPLTPEGRPVDLTETVVIVDDSWALVGDAGLRRRSLTFDAGISFGLSDLALQDSAPKLVRSMRIDLLKRALAVREEDSARLADFYDAFETVVGLCQRRLSQTVIGYDETWRHLPDEQRPTIWRDAVDPDGRSPGGEPAVMGLVTELFKLVSTSTQELREVAVTWQPPQALQSQAATYALAVRETGRPEQVQLAESLTPQNNRVTYKLRCLERDKAYEVYATCSSGGKSYRAPQTGWKCSEAQGTSLDLGAMAQVRQVRLTWKLPAVARRWVMSFALSYRQAGGQKEGELRIDLLPDENNTCRCPLLLPDPGATYEVWVEGELETRRYEAAAWKAAASDEVDLGVLVARG